MEEDSVLEESVTEKGNEMVQVGAALKQTSQTVLTTHLRLHQKSPLLPYWNLLPVGFDRIGPLNTRPDRGSYTSTVFLAT